MDFHRVCAGGIFKMGIYDFLSTIFDLGRASHACVRVRAGILVRTYNTWIYRFGWKLSPLVDGLGLL